METNDNVFAAFMGIVGIVAGIFIGQLYPVFDSKPVPVEPEWAVPIVVPTMTQWVHTAVHRTAPEPEERASDVPDTPDTPPDIPSLTNSPTLSLEDITFIYESEIFKKLTRRDVPLYPGSRIKVSWFEVVLGAALAVEVVDEISEGQGAEQKESE